jgi:hypothetical protein
MKTMALLLGIAIASLTLTSCSCWTDQAKANDPGCIIAHDVVDCTTGAVEGALPYFASIVMGLITGGTDPNNIPWDNIETQAESMGVKDGGCFLAELQNLIFGKPSASPTMLAARREVSSRLSAYKQKHFGNTTVKFKIKGPDGKEVLL